MVSTWSVLHKHMVPNLEIFFLVSGKLLRSVGALEFLEFCWSSKFQLFLLMLFSRVVGLVLAWPPARY